MGEWCEALSYIFVLWWDRWAKFGDLTFRVTLKNFLLDLAAKVDSNSGRFFRHCDSIRDTSKLIDTSPLAARNSKLQINFAHDEVVQSVMLCKRNENMPRDSNKLVERVKLPQIGVPSLQNECTMPSEMSNL